MTGRRGARRQRTAALHPPEMPPKLHEDTALERLITIELQELAAALRQRNLDNAVLLAQMAARNRGPLVDHFIELGRRFAALLDAPQKPALRLVAGGAEDEA